MFVIFAHARRRHCILFVVSRYQSSEKKHAEVSAALATATVTIAQCPETAPQQKKHYQIAVTAAIRPFPESTTPRYN